MKKNDYDLIVIGSTIGGVLAAYSAAKMGLKVALVSEFKLIGGQLTSEAVPPDENIYIESGGASQSYLDFRQQIRKKYLNNPNLKPQYQSLTINPGGGWVSNLCALPEDFYNEFLQMLSKKEVKANLTIYYLQNEIRSVVENNIILKVIFDNYELAANYFVDASLYGDFLVKSQAKYLIGAEAQSKFNEPNAPVEASQSDIQPITWIAAVSYHEGEDHTIEKPAMYEHFKKASVIPNHSMLSFKQVGLNPGDTVLFHMFEDENRANLNEPDLRSLFEYRKIFDPIKFKNCSESPITIINWPQNDYVFGNVITNRKQTLHEARQLTLSLVYWLQTEAPRDDKSGLGYPGLKLRPDITKTDDGLAMSPYLRETYRLDALYIVNENDVTKKTNYEDSVGIGHYNIDLHLTYFSRRHLFLETYPFEIPLRSLISKNIKNLLAGSKNIGVSHIANGCYRLHPIEWNIGEVCGYLAAFAKNKHINAFQDISTNKKLITEFQQLITKKGVKIRWEQVKKDL